jgi:hypothetical protein
VVCSSDQMAITGGLFLKYSLDVLAALYNGLKNA